MAQPGGCGHTGRGDKPSPEAGLPGPGPVDPPPWALSLPSPGFSWTPSAPAGLKDVRGFAEMESRFLGPKARPAVLSTWQAGCLVRAFSLHSLRVKPAPPPGSGTAQVCKSLLGDCTQEVHLVRLGVALLSACSLPDQQPPALTRPPSSRPPNPPLLLLPPRKSGCSQTKPPAPR